MAILRGIMQFRGSLGNTRAYRVVGNPETILSLKGGPTAAQIDTRPSLDMVKRNAVEFGGCASVSKTFGDNLDASVKRSFDSLYQSRYMQVIRRIQLRDVEGIIGARLIAGSQARPSFLGLVLNKKHLLSLHGSDNFVSTHPVSRAEATLTVTMLQASSRIKRGVGNVFRVWNQLVVVSDASLSIVDNKYHPLSLFNGWAAFTATDWAPVEVPLLDVCKASFPIPTVLDEDCTVVQIVGIEYAKSYGLTNYIPYANSELVIWDAF